MYKVKMSKHLLSIIIPTKNRQKYCIEAINQIISTLNSGVEIIIQDNSDTAELKTVVTTLNYDRLVYNYHPGELSFIDNFNEALTFASGEYLCMIGDDDGVLPDIIKITEFAKINNYDAIIPGLNSVYCWPNKNAFVKNGEKGYLCLSYIKNKGKEIQTEKELVKLIKNGGQNYQSYGVPRLYHGIVCRKILNKIYNITGKYFDGLTPDIYMAVALSFVCKKVCGVNYPVTISGICPKSGSSDSATGKHTGDLKNAPHFKGHTSYIWDPKAPAIYSVESIWAETVMKALHAFHREDLYSRFGVNVLDGICFAKYPQFKNEIKKHAKKNGVSIFNLYYQKIKFLIIPFVKRALKRIFRKKGEVQKYYDVSDITQAAEITIAELYKLGIL